MAFFHISCRSIRHAMRHVARCTLYVARCTLQHLAVSLCKYLRILQVVFNTLISIVTHPQPGLISCCFIIRPAFCLHLCEKVKKMRRKREIEGEGEQRNRFPFLQPISSQNYPTNSFRQFSSVRFGSLALLCLLVYFSRRFLWLFICFQFLNCARCTNKCMYECMYIYIASTLHSSFPFRSFFCTILPLNMFKKGILTLCQRQKRRG